MYEKYRNGLWQLKMEKETFSLKEYRKKYWDDEKVLAETMEFRKRQQAAARSCSRAAESGDQNNKTICWDALFMFAIHVGTCVPAGCEPPKDTMLFLTLCLQTTDENRCTTVHYFILKGLNTKRSDGNNVKTDIIANNIAIPVKTPK